MGDVYQSAETTPTPHTLPTQQVAAARTLSVPNYHESPSKFGGHILAFLIGFIGGFGLLFVFYKLLILSTIGGAVIGMVYIFINAQQAAKKRLLRLRRQFFDMLEALSVAMRAGNHLYKALQSAREDLLLLYPDTSDIIVEIDIMLGRFDNGVMLSDSFIDFANRCGLDDVMSFASIYKTIEGKSSRADEIVRQTQEIIADKMSIEMEIETLMTGAKSEVNIMLFMPVAILGIIGYTGAGFLDAIYTTAIGRLIATVGLIVFFISYAMARAFSQVKL